MKVAIVGYGKQGRAAYDYWLAKGAEITICDRQESIDLPSGAYRQIGDSYLRNLDRFDLVVRGPSVHPDDIINVNSLQLVPKITTVTNEFLRVCPTRNIVGVTGTKGKGTTSTLTAKMLEAAGKRVHLGGNIGIPPLDLLKNDIKEDDWVVLELANFQLIDLQYSPRYAVCLMVMPEHLDWHPNVAEYYDAKAQLFRYQTPEDFAVYYDKNDISKQIASAGQGQKIPYMSAAGADVVDGNIVIGGQTICNVSELKLLGQHNWQNVCAATTIVWQAVQDVAAMRQVLTTFSGLEHRLEFVRELNGVRYYDDSFGTAPATSIVAIQAFNQPKVIILGGSDKGVPYDDLAEAVAHDQVRCAVLIGEQADRIRSALERAGFTDTMPGGETMTDIVATARSAAQPGDVVLLSPGCASFDMFQNYIDRAEQFKTAVLALV